MATRQYDIAISDEPSDINESVGGAISDQMRVIIDTDDTVVTKNDALLLLNKLAQRILKGDWLPA